MALDTLIVRPPVVAHICQLTNRAISSSYKPSKHLQWADVFTRRDEAEDRDADLKVLCKERGR